MKPKHIAIITDSTCDLPPEFLQQYNIKVIPQIIIWDEVEYRDQIDIQPEEFFRRLRAESSRPTTSLPTVSDFAAIYQEAIQEGADEIVTVTISSAMSGTYQVARTAAQMVEIPVHVVDSKGPTMTLGWQVLSAARCREAGGDTGAILANIEKTRQTMRQYVSLDSLEYLQRGGRIGGAARWIGTRLNIKPLVCINHNTGLVEPVGLARTSKKAVEMLFEKFFAGIQQDRPLHLAVLHCDALEQAQALAERVRKQYSPVELMVNITGPVLGANTGPGALALCGYTE